MRKGAVNRTAVGKLWNKCQERADIMHSVNETARKIPGATESDELNMKRIRRHSKSVPSANCLIEFITFPQSVSVNRDSDWARQPMTCKSTSGGVVQWRKINPF